MEVTFLVSLEINSIDPITLTQEASDIQEDLLDKGHDVIAVKPWARPNLAGAAPSGGFTSLTGTPSPDAQLGNQT